MNPHKKYSLEYGESVILKRNKGNRVIEFSRHPDKTLDNFVLMWKYDSKKTSKGPAVNLILKDLPDFIEAYTNKGEYELLPNETNTKKTLKK